MRKQFHTGLVVGEFAPLHRGHEFVIESARAACEQVVLVSYSLPEFAPCAAPIRAGWLAARFPDARRCVLQATGYVAADLDADARTEARALARTMPRNDAPEREHHAFVAALCTRVLRARVEAMFSSTDDGDAGAAALTAALRAGDPAAPAVQHVVVDRVRAHVPCTAQQVRADVHAHRAFLSPLVYASFVERVCVLGGESSGKTSLARHLAQHFDTAWVKEYGREVWQRRGGALQLDDLRRIAETQVAHEEEGARQARRFLFCDTSPLSTLFYSQRMFGRADARVTELANRPYAHTVLCAPDFPFVQDGTRQGSQVRTQQHEWYVLAMEQRAITPHLAVGSLVERGRAVAAWLAAGGATRR